MQTVSNFGWWFWDYLAAGGPLMGPLFLAGCVMWTLIISRTWTLTRLYRKNMTRKTAAAFIRRGEAPDPARYKGQTARLVRVFLNKQTHDPALDREILDEMVVAQTHDLDRYLTLIGVLAAVAPLLGLLGTVLGMISTFDTISLFGTGNARAMAGGISEALITTQAGLLVAIPGLYMKNFLERRAQNLKKRTASVAMFLQRQL